MDKTKSTEENILVAAREVFMKKGFSAARMCDIAHEANINPALLHYYFRKKDKLFDMIFVRESNQFHANILSILQSDLPFFEKLKQVIEADIRKITAAPYIPMFILNEMHSNAERIKQYNDSIPKQKEVFKIFIGLVEKEQMEGRIRQVCPRQLLISLFGMTMFPFLAQPMIQASLDLEQVNFDQIIGERTQFLYDFIKGSLEVVHAKK